MKSIVLALATVLAVQAQAQTEKSQFSARETLRDAQLTAPWLYLTPSAGLTSVNLAGIKLAGEELKSDVGGTVGGTVDIGSSYAQFQTGTTIMSIRSCSSTA